MEKIIELLLSNDKSNRAFRIVLAVLVYLLYAELTLWIFELAGYRASVSEVSLMKLLDIFTSYYLALFLVVFAALIIVYELGIWIVNEFVSWIFERALVLLGIKFGLARISDVELGRPNIESILQKSEEETASFQITAALLGLVIESLILLFICYTTIIAHRFDGLYNEAIAWVGAILVGIGVVFGALVYWVHGQMKKVDSAKRKRLEGLRAA
jgi:putative effector of murein hydrolase LrgA (UPF0299 family)